QQVPASFANLDAILNGPQATTTLDQDGCLDVTSQYFDANGDPSSTRSSWQVWLNSRFTMPSGSGIVDWRVAAVPDAFKTLNADGTVNDPTALDKKMHAILGRYEVTNVGCSTVSPGGVVLAVPEDPPATDIQNTDIMNVAAVTSRVLFSPDMAIVPGTYWSFARDVCDGAAGTDPESLQIRAARDSCFSPSGDALYIGTSLAVNGSCPANDTCFSQSYWKYVVAHETGHMVQSHSVGSFSQTYNIPNAAPSVCRCDHVEASNQVHCLQSVEGDTGAQIEGFAQFFASRVWNDPQSPTCEFVYYKEFLRPDSTPCPTGRTCIAGPLSKVLPNGVQVTIPAGFHAEVPPLGVDCRQAVKWRNRQCTVGGDFSVLGTEYDWMGFFYNMNTIDLPAGTRYAMTDLNATYIASCAPATSCSRAQPDYMSLLMGDESHFGMNDRRSVRFRSSATTYGVSLDTSP
ncbi:MAG: hypothetical protein ACREJ3_13850, partial [Polyangiaceae bacterium]